MADRALLDRAVESIRAYRDRELARCAKACFHGPDGKTPTLEGERVLADLRRNAKLFGSSITRDRGGAIDRDEMLRMEGRREVTLRLINLLELDPMEVARFVEVDDGRT